MTVQTETDDAAESSGPRVVASPTTGEAVPLFSGAWFAGIALRYSMVIIILLVIAYFSYRSARFSTVDNLVLAMPISARSGASRSV